MSRKRTVAIGLVGLGIAALVTISGPTAAANPRTGLADTDWKNITVPIPDGTHCPAGDVKFENGEGESGNYLYRMLPDESSAVYGDLDANGDEDALLRIQCGPKNSEYSDALVVVSSNNDSLYAFGTVFRPDEWTQQITDYAAYGSVIRVTISDMQQESVKWFHWDSESKEFVEITQ